MDEPTRGTEEHIDWQLMNLQAAFAERAKHLPEYAAFVNMLGALSRARQLGDRTIGEDPKRTAASYVQHHAAILHNALNAFR